MGGLTAGTGAGNGYTSTGIALPNNTALDGTLLYGRWYVTDPAAPGGIAATPAFRFSTFGSTAAPARVEEFEMY